MTTDELRAYFGQTPPAAGDPLLQLALDGAVALAKSYIGRDLPDPVPADLKDAIYTLAARRVHERNAGYQDAVSGDFGPIYFKQLPASVKLVLDAHTRPQVFLA